MPSAGTPGSSHAQAKPFEHGGEVPGIDQLAVDRGLAAHRVDGTAAGSLLEAEVVTADGVARTVNACQEPELFWALKGGGGGTLGVITRLTLRTHDMPETVGAVFMTVCSRARNSPLPRRRERMPPSSTSSAALWRSTTTVF